jgi:hypothetical protein
MSQTDGEIRPQFTKPYRQITLMLIALGLAGVGVFFALPRVLPVFQSNPYLNGFILFVFIIGLMACFYQVIQLIGSVGWIETFAAGESSEDDRVPSLLTPLATLLRSRGVRMHLSSTATRSILDTVATRIDEDREITRYIVNLLIFLGLLGTFYGLATTVPAVVETIRSLAPQEGEESLTVFKRLMTGLESQLGGMGTAFASSLLGLAGSLIVGLLELFAGHGQNRFYRELEEWLSSITRVGFSTGEETGGGGGDTNAMSGALDHMAEQMRMLQELFVHSDESRATVDHKLGQLVDVIGDMNERMDRTDSTAAALDRVAVGQETMIEVMRAQGPGEGMDAESRMRLRSIDVQMLRILEEISAGRQESLAELRKDIDLLVKTLARPRAAARRARAADQES